MKLVRLWSFAVGVAVALRAVALGAVDFKKQVRPILEANCLKCHGSEKPKGKLSLVTRADAVKGGEDGVALTPGDPDKSPIYTSTTLPADNDKAMPPKGARLSAADQATLRQWVQEGALWPQEIALSQKEKIDFVRQAKPILEVHCVACHKEGHAKGELRLDDKEAFFKSKDVVPGDAQGSKVFTSMILAADDDDLMPPKKKGGPLPKHDAEVIRDWIDQGAFWPDGMKLQEREPDTSLTRDEPALYAALHQLLVKGNASPSGGKLEAYTEKLPGSVVSFEMASIPEGDFEMGSPDSETGRKPDEGPVHKVHIDPFWIGRREVTWNEYELFQFPNLEKGVNVSTERVNRELLLMLDFPKNDTGANPYIGKEADAVSRPTTPYVEMSFGMGKEGFPAISMTHFAALAYCRWLSAKTGHFYRLATEAEWEYACRAGTKTRFFWGDDATKAGEYAWYSGNSEEKYQKAGSKKPNPWGLYDMLGNVAEWTMDGYKADAYSTLPPSNPWLPGFAEYPHVARGGSWDDEIGDLRCAARRHSDSSWKMRDPQLPKSKWYLTDAQFLGFRIVRSPKVPATPEELKKVWTSFTPRE